ncbi:pentapeptide repeat-containing protein, partial [Nonomuraea sp. NPDC055795]
CQDLIHLSRRLEQTSDRISGIYALQRLAADSPRDAHTIISVLAAFVRGHDTCTPAAKGEAPPKPCTINDEADIAETASITPGADVFAAIDGAISLARDIVPPDPEGAYSWVSLRKVRFPSTVLGSRDWRGAQRTMVDLGDANLQGADLRGAQLAFVHLVDADLRRANLGYAELPRANLSNAKLNGADLTNAHLDDAQMSFATLTDAQLFNASLARADLRNVQLRNAKLTKADLRGAMLHKADLRGADLRIADLTRADLRDANLTGADLQGANLNGTILAGANLSGVKGLTDRNLEALLQRTAG